MIKQLFVGVVLTLGASFCASAQFALGSYEKNATTIGAFTALSGWNSSAALGLEGTYAFMEECRLAVDTELAMPRHGLAAFSVNGNFQTPFAIENVSELTLYPLVGLNIAVRHSNLNNHNTHLTGGLNLGFGGEWTFSPSLGAFVANKIVLTSGTHYEFMAGVRYRL